MIEKMPILDMSSEKKNAPTEFNMYSLGSETRRQIEQEMNGF